jgi:hypothetical protein
MSDNSRPAGFWWQGRRFGMALALALILSGVGLVMAGIDYLLRGQTLSGGFLVLLASYAILTGYSRWRQVRASHVRLRETGNAQAPVSRSSRSLTLLRAVVLLGIGSLVALGAVELVRRGQLPTHDALIVGGCVALVLGGSYLLFRRSASPEHNPREPRAVPLAIALALATALIALVGLDYWQRSEALTPAAILTWVLAAAMGALTVLVILAELIRREQRRLAGLFGFPSLSAYYEDRVAKGWTTEQLAAELGRSARWVNRFRQRQQAREALLRKYRAIP